MRAIRRVFYLGSRPLEENTGGITYMNEVVDYLISQCAVIFWDPEKELRSFRKRVNRLTPQSFLRQMISNLWGIRKLQGIGNDEIVIMNSYLRHRFLLFALWARYITRCELIIFVNAIYQYSRGSEFLNTVDRCITRLLLKQATLVIANSESTKEEILDLGIDGCRVEVIQPRLSMPPDVDGLGKGPQVGTFEILYVGYCEPFKEVHILIKAIGRLRSLPVCLHIIGDMESDPEYVAMIRRLIQQLGIEDRVVFHGRIKKCGLGEWFKRADVFVSPGRGEGYGRALAEAMYFGLPVIGADRGASKELIDDGVNGFLFRSGCDESLAVQILRLFEDEELREKCGRKAREAIQRKANFDQNVGEQFYWTLLDRGMGRGQA